MSTLSPLQSLPIHVAQMIADHVVGSSRLRLDNVTVDTEGYGMLLLPLLGVVTAFVLLRPRSSLPARLNKTDFPVHLHVQELEFEVDMLDVCRGAVLEELIRMNLLGVTYPVAHKLSVKVSSLSTKSHRADNVTDPKYFEKVISLFVERLIDMVPMVKKVCVTLASSPDQRPLIADSYLGNFVKQLFRLSDDVSYNVSGTTMSLEYQPTAIRHLVHMDAYGCDKSQLMMDLARLNAATMEFLTIGFWFLDDISPLFQNADGSYVQYPSLHTLMLASNPDITVPLRPVHPGAVPFPALRRLTMCSGYFGDDTPFRGNADTLELLDLYLSPEAFKVLKTHKIFTPISHQQLRRVKLGQITRREQNLFRTDTEFVRFVTNIGPNAVERVINNSLRAPILQSTVPVLSDHTCIQTLDLPFTKLELWDVLALVKALPLLSNLKSEVPAIGKLPKGVSEERLPAYVRETYSPVGVQFRRWRLVASASVNMDQVVMCILLVALACPNFDYAAVPHQNREVLMAHMKVIIEEDGFRQRAPRLRRLLFGEWNNEFPDVEAAHARSDEARMAAITTAMANYRV